MPKTTPRAPSPRPARGFTAGQAQTIVLASAILTAVIYAFRRLVEPTTGTGQPAGSTAAKLAGKGTPPTVEHWAVSYAAAFLMLSFLAMAAPEAAASIALMVVTGNLLTNGLQIAGDLNTLQGKPPTAAPAVRASTPSSGTLSAQAVNQATGAGG